MVDLGVPLMVYMSLSSTEIWISSDPSNIASFSFVADATALIDFFELPRTTLRSGNSTS
jgi:hypothetical protein